MSESAGWGVPDFLPPRVQRRMLQAEARDNIDAKEADREREALAEARHTRALQLYCEQAEIRGEDISAVALATGRIRGRSVQDILRAASLEADRQDVIEAARLRRDGYGDAQPVHVEVGEPTILSSPVKRSIANRSRRWQEWQDKKAAAEAARRAAVADRDIGLVDGVTLRHRSEPSSVLETRTTRAGGPEPTFGPMNLPWAQVAGWLARGWRP